jgi:hypothetical protein
MKLVWLNIETGEFSESWDEEEFSLTDTLDMYSKYTKAGWKLIRYDCLTDEDFQFNNLMVIK